MFILAFPEDSEHIAYFDSYFNKYIAKGGHLAWRINNPGLVHSHSHVAKKNGSIGACNAYAIFATPEQGYTALSDWLHLKKYYNSTTQTVAAHYQPTNPEQFISRLVRLTDLPRDKELKSLPKYRFEALIKAIAKLCNYIAIGNEELTMLPKIMGKIEGDTRPSYLIGNDIVLSQTEAIDWIQSHRLDALIVHEANGDIHLRSRPHHTLWYTGKDNESPSIELFLRSETPVDTIVRSAGKKKTGQCIWGFINGISNTKTKAASSAELISTATGGEEVLYLPNDSVFVDDLSHCLILKLDIDTPIILLAEKFFNYLLNISKQFKPEPPIVIFAHSQGAIIAEHA